ncbi:tyrosine-protein phosphatase [Eubacterium aggregans]|uniref:tyrosine-protein phosphatase n=2 Tax=Eubacterium aggregans TaxID=81409 RepID=UPI0023F2787C|nr:CpsB/CapC family capsule biosynthesis tyrosine phosphatase [Eubacterium aggregans]MDD4691736.1 capsular biosynthesis protein [Eubacterium aggregans]
MIDMHNHVLYGVDDGAECLEDSLAMLAEAARVGYTGVVLTPHYMVYQDYTATVRENQVRLAHLERALDEAGIPITLYLGSELFYDYELVGRIGTGAFKTLGDSPYYLVETGRQGGTALGIQNFMGKLKISGGKTILAHPERYDFVQEDPNVLLEFMAAGTLIQSNYLSLIGYYGGATQRTLETMLSHDMVQLLGSDAHQSEGYALYPEAADAGITLVGKEKWQDLVCVNPEKVILGTGTITTVPHFYKAPATKSVIGRFTL